MEHNAYQAPESSILEEAVEVKSNSVELASRWRRLGASIVDSIILMIPSMIIMYYTGFFDHVTQGKAPPTTDTLLIFVAGLAIYIAFNIHSLKANGQTLGKKALGIKVVDMNYEKPTLATLILKRYFPYAICGQIPAVGQIITTINVLLIFRQDKRCGHDLIAGTQVVNC